MYCTWNSYRVVGEGVITTNTLYSGDRVVTQNFSTRDNAGSVKTETVYGGKVLP